jgi:DUF1680 family protein
VNLYVSSEATFASNYCCEAPGVEGGQVLGLRLDAKNKMEASLENDLTVIRTQARNISDPSSASKPVTLIPYYWWANRGAGAMAGQRRL